MSKTNRLYKIFMTSMIVIIAGLLLATGIIAIQKSMKMNLSFEANPNYLFEVYIQKSGDDTKKLVFRNYEKSASEGVVMENGFSTLYGNTLTADDTFLETYGSDFEFIIENHTKNSGMRVSVTANSETEGGHEGILPTITEDKMTATKLKDGSTADYIRFSVTTTEVVFPQTTVLNIVFSEYNEYAVGVSPSSGNFTYTANPVAISGENYTANIKAKTGYDLEITVTRDDGTTTTLTAGQGKDYVWDSSTGALTIYASAVTGDITINCLNDNAISYAISYTLNGGSVEPANPTKYTVEDTFTLTNPTKTGYNFDGWTGTGLANATTTVTISQMTGDRSYTATWTAKTYTVTYNLTGCTKTSGATSVAYGASFSAKFSANTGYSLPNSVTVVNISSGGYSWDSSTGAFEITDWTKVNGNITITVAAALPYTIKAYDGTNTAAWGGYYCVEFGEYPQSIRENNVTILDENGNNITSTTATGTIGYSSDGAKYYYQADVNGYGTSEWYKFEPIRWMIIATSGELTDTTIYGNGATKHADMPEANENKKQLLLLSEYNLYPSLFNDSDLNKFFGSVVQVSLNNAFADMSGLRNYFADTVGESGPGKYIAKVQPRTAYSTYGNKGAYKELDTESSYNMFLLGVDVSDYGLGPDTYAYTNYVDGSKIRSIPTDFASAAGAVGCTLLRTGSLKFYLSVYAYWHNRLDNERDVYNSTSDVRPCFILNLA